MIFPYILFTCFLVALYLTVKQCKKETLKYPENRLSLLLSLSSTIWSFGFWMLNLQTQPERAQIFRVIGMVGVLGYLIMAQLFVCYLSGTLQAYRYPITCISFIGLVIYFFIVKEEQVTFEVHRIGMTYHLNRGFWSTVYTIFCIAVAFNILASIIYMFFHAQRKRIRALAKKLMLVESIIVFGMVLDATLPLFGGSAVLGSTIGQCVGILAVYRAVNFINRSHITVDNMSSYVYSSLTTPVLVFDENYKLCLFNDVACQFLGLPKENVDNISIASLFSAQIDEMYFLSNKQKNMDVVCNYNRVHCNISISKIFDDYSDVIGYIVAVTDISERLEYITKLEQAIKDAENANQAKTTFLANMSHEIRTPMNAVIGFAELALKKEISKEVREYIENIRLASRNLLAIINDILDITKIESGKMEVVPANYYIADLLDDVSLIISQQAKKKGLAFVMKTDEQVPTKLFGDKVRLRGALINILNNAVKYTKEGTVTFEVKVLNRIDDALTLSFIIKDTGIGIRPEDQENLFKSFARFDQRLHYGVEGSGLGLSIAKGYITLMGGEITVDSVYGQGSVFTININQKIIDDTPLQHQFTIDKGKQDAPEPCQVTIHDVRVLVVDDNHINLLVIKGLLESYGLTVDTAPCGATAIDLCKKTHYPIVFMDQMMPEMDGIEAMQRIRGLDSYYALGGESKIIVLTADAIRGVRESLLEKGFDEYLGKPMNLRQLERLMITYLPSDNITVSTRFPEDADGQDDKSDEEAADKPEDGSQDADINFLQEKLPEVDLSIGLKNCGGKTDDYLKILNINYEYGSKNLNELSELLRKKDYENYTIKVHSMKSTTKNIGALKISDMAREQEEAGRAGRYDDIDANFDALRTEYEKLLGKIEEVLRHYQILEEPVTDSNGEMLDGKMINGILSNIRMHVDAFDFDPVFEILKKRKQYRLPEAYAELFEQLEAAMEDLNVDEVRRLIENAPAD